MKKFAKVIGIVTAILALCFTLAACNKYSSHYSASAMVSTNTSNKATVSFGTFKGTYVIKLQNNGNGNTAIAYNATLENGNIKVYYDFNGEKLDLFEIGADGSVQDKTEAFTGGKTIYIIIESDGKCNEGNFSFSLEKVQE